MYVFMNTHFFELKHFLFVFKQIEEQWIQINIGNQRNVLKSCATNDECIHQYNKTLEYYFTFLLQPG